MSKTQWRRGGATRLIVAPPAKDESLSSVVDRAAAQYGIGTDGALGALLRDWAEYQIPFDRDDLPDEMIGALAEAIGITSESLADIGITDEANILAPGARLAYCPLCFEKDLALNRIPYFRKAWSSIFAVTCKEEGAPLFAWPMVSAYRTRALPLPGDLRGNRRFSEDVEIRSALRIAQGIAANDVPADGRVLADVASLAKAMRLSLCGDGTWPAGWHGTVWDAKALLEILTVNRSKLCGRTPLDSLVPSVATAGLFRAYREMQAPLGRRRPWAQIKGIIDPAVRRSAFWVIARTINPRAYKAVGLAWMPHSIIGSSEAGWLNVLGRALELP